ncbi:hypothetical protein AB0M79_27280 [Polymorphospora sp. NPDC051019]|uniref:hypothetical protein n=1 Tax=Polymorphospora sp. NPDC051019 TaxID=3155725 RepID=UPI0034286591
MTDHPLPAAVPPSRSGAAGRPGAGGWLFGPGATRAEQVFAWLAAAAGLAAVGVAALDLDWSWWQVLVAAVLVVDLAGGVVANGLDSAKRFYHGPPPAHLRATGRFLHHPVGFAAVHVQPIAIGLLFAGGVWWWGTLWWAVALAGTVLVNRLPAHLARPAALLVVTGTVFAAPAVPGPDGFWWLPAVLTLKLVLAHAVPEGPRRTQDASIIATTSTVGRTSPNVR